MIVVSVGIAGAGVCRKRIPSHLRDCRYLLRLPLAKDSGWTQRDKKPAVHTKHSNFPTLNSATQSQLVILALNKAMFDTDCTRLLIIFFPPFFPWTTEQIDQTLVRGNK